MESRKTQTWRHREPILTADLSPAAAKAVSRAAQAGEISKIREGLYTGQPRDAWPELMRRNARDIVAALYPGAVASWRSGSIFGGGPAEDTFFLTYGYTRDIELPGLTLKFIKGPGPVAGDVPWKDGRLHIAGQERTLLENLAISRGSPKRSAGPQEVRKFLAAQLGARGEASLNAIRDTARGLAPQLGLDREMKLLDEIISKLLVTHASDVKQQLKGPMDERRVALFDALSQYLISTPSPAAQSTALASLAVRNSAFIESYFSNFIEGTEFEIAEAVEIAINGKLPSERPKDAHDILGVMDAAMNPLLRAAALPTGPGAVGHIQELHRTVMQNRPEVEPGAFKKKPNRAGATEFVHPDLVKGTLVEMAHRTTTVPEGLARGIFVMFGVAEVHPFNDGNGRIARLLMNAELSRCGLQRIIVPSIFREEYLDGLRAMSRNSDPAPLVAVLVRLQAWSAQLAYDDLDGLLAQLRRTNAFETERTHFRLLAPTDAKPPAMRNP